MPRNAIPMILEGIVTTLAPSGEVNIAPMGACVDTSMRRLLLQPFDTSQTYRNLKAHGEGVFHVTDDVLLLARAAVGRLEAKPTLLPATTVRGFVLADACRAYEFRARSLDESRERIPIDAEVVRCVCLRDFFGFNRAKHAVVEAAILATRIAFLPLEDIRTEYRKLGILVEKTGGPAEQEAFAFLQAHVEVVAAGGQTERSHRR
jgi:hypothetical protein